MDNNRHRPALAPETEDKTGPAKGITNGLGLVLVFAVLVLAVGVVLSLGVWAIAAIWGAIL